MAGEDASAKRARLDVPGEIGRVGLDAMLAWLRHKGASLDGLEFRSDGQAGYGVFTTRRISCAEPIATIPAAAVLTLDVARASPLGVAAAAAGASDELLMWIFMAHGRADETHPWHAYLASLPEVQPDPTSWPDGAMAALRGTPLAQMVNDAKAMLRRELAAVLERLEPPSGSADWWPVAWESLTFERVLWARGVHLSRCFPAQLGRADNADVRLYPDSTASSSVGENVERGQTGANVGLSGAGDVGCLLPLFDMLNHKRGQAIIWEASDGNVAFRAAGSDLQPGDEVFNNYGAGRSNEQLLFFYGFAEPDVDMTRDVVTGMVLELDFDADSSVAANPLAAKHRRLLEEGVPCALVGPSSSTLRLGPFELGTRGGCVGGASASNGSSGSTGTRQSVLPSQLLFALGVAVADTATDEVDLSALPADAFAVLHGTLAASLAAAHGAPEPPEQPAHRAASIRSYCEGRRRILRSALEEVEDRLAEFDSEAECEA